MSRRVGVAISTCVLCLVVLLAVAPLGQATGHGGPPDDGRTEAAQATVEAIVDVCVRGGDAGRRACIAWATGDVPAWAKRNADALAGWARASGDAAVAWTDRTADRTANWTWNRSAALEGWADNETTRAKGYKTEVSRWGSDTIANIHPDGREPEPSCVGTQGGRSDEPCIRFVPCVPFVELFDVIQNELIQAECFESSLPDPAGTPSPPGMEDPPIPGTPPVDREAPLPSDLPAPDPLPRPDGDGEAPGSAPEAVVPPSTGVVPASRDVHGTPDAEQVPATGIAVLSGDGLIPPGSLPEEDLGPIVVTGLLVLGLGSLATLRLYRRLSRDEILDHDLRARTLEILREDPGLYLRELADRLEVAATTALYHCRVLEDAGFLATERSAGRTHLFAVDGGMSRLERRVRTLLRADGKGAVLRALAEAPGLHVSDVARRVGRHRSTVARHADDLVADGLVEDRSDGGTRRLSLTPAARRAVERLDAVG